MVQLVCGNVIEQKRYDLMVNNREGTPNKTCYEVHLAPVKPSCLLSS
jgi:hypothetical protein